jgi:predicted nuclease of predicted toxin-antitoxin system
VRILLDECVPWPMRHLLSAHQCTNVQKQGWKGTKNGALLALAASEFDLFITSDQNIRYQQNLLGSTIAVLELSTNDLRRIRAAATMIQSEVSAIKPGAYRRIRVP